MTGEGIPAPGKLRYTYRRPFRVDGLDCELVLRSGLRGNFSELLVGGVATARDFTPASSAA